MNINPNIPKKIAVGMDDDLVDRAMISLQIDTIIFHIGPETAKTIAIQLLVLSDRMNQIDLHQTKTINE